MSENPHNSAPTAPAAAGPAAPPFVPKSWPMMLGYIGASMVIGLTQGLAQNSPV